MFVDNNRNERENDPSSDISEEVRRFFPENGFSKPQKICFKVLTDFEEIKECLHLRYLTFRYVNFIEENMDRLDIDSYDRYSTFLGAYSITGWRRTLVGTLRIIDGSEKSPTASCIDELIRTARDRKIRSLGDRQKLFPIMESFKLPQSYLECFGNSNDSSVHPYEISRLAIRPDFWMYGIEVGLHHLLILESWRHNPPRNDFLIAVHPRTYKRYKSIGFKVVPGTDQVIYKHINQLAIAMIINLQKYLDSPRSYRKTCESLLPTFSENGFFTQVHNKRTSLNTGDRGI